jgi:ribosomal protein S18 acetylase RimI-like enzyme
MESRLIHQPKFFSRRFGMPVESLTLQNLNGPFSCMKENPFMPDPEPELDLARSFIAQNLGNSIDGVIGISGGGVNGIAFYGALHRSPVAVETDKKVSVIHCVHVSKNARRSGLGRSMVDHIKRKSQKYAGVLVLAREDDDEHFMHYIHFERMKFKTVESINGIRYMYHPTTRTSIKITPMEIKYQPTPGKVDLAICNFDYCPYFIRLSKEIRKAASELDDKVSVSTMDMNCEETEKCGVSGMNYLIDGKPMFRGLNIPYDFKSELQAHVK